MEIEHILGIDYGKKRIGLALAQKQSPIAQALSLLIQSPHHPPERNVFLICEKYHVHTIILGNPLGKNGEPTEMSRVISEFKLALEDMAQKQSWELKVILWDETLTSFQAYEHLLQKGLSHERIKESLDMESARIILQEYCDSIYSESNHH